MAIIVAHPDTQHSVHAAVGLKRAHLLRMLFTAFSLKRDWVLGRMVKKLAPAAHRRLAQHRGHEELDISEIRTCPGHLVAMRLGKRAYQWSQLRFARQAGWLGVQEASGVLAFNSVARDTFRILKSHGLPCILDQTIAHRAWSNRVGQQECDENPEWGDHWATTPEQLEHDLEEISLADQILCGSAFCADTMSEEGVSPSRLSVVEYGADTQRFTPSTRSPRRTSDVRVLFVGALALRKGLHYLLRAATRLESLKLRVTAAGVRQVSADALARYGAVLEPVGFRLHQDMPTLYREHDIYVFPSLVEGSSLSIYEALASGLPVITTPNAGSIVRDEVEGLIVPPRSVEALAAAIERLARDPDLRLEMGRAARRRAETYGDWSHYGMRLAAVVQRIEAEWENGVMRNTSPGRP